MTVAISVREHDRIAEATGEQTVADRLHFVRAQVANVADSADAGDVSIEWAATEADVAGTAGRGEIDALRGDQRTVSCPHDQQPKVAVRGVYEQRLLLLDGRIGRKAGAIGRNDVVGVQIIEAAAVRALAGLIDQALFKNCVPGTVDDMTARERVGHDRARPVAA